MSSNGRQSNSYTSGKAHVQRQNVPYTDKHAPRVLSRPKTAPPRLAVRFMNTTNHEGIAHVSSVKGILGDRLRPPYAWQSTTDTHIPCDNEPVTHKTLDANALDVEIQHKRALIKHQGKSMIGIEHRPTYAWQSNHEGHSAHDSEPFTRVSHNSPIPDIHVLQAEMQHMEAIIKDQENKIEDLKAQVHDQDLETEESKAQLHTAENRYGFIYRSIDEIYDQIRAVLIPHDIPQSGIPSRRENDACESFHQDILCMISTLKKEIGKLNVEKRCQAKHETTDASSQTHGDDRPVHELHDDQNDKLKAALHRKDKEIERTTIAFQTLKTHYKKQRETVASQQEYISKVHKKLEVSLSEIEELKRKFEPQIELIEKEKTDKRLINIAHHKASNSALVEMKKQLEEDSNERQDNLQNRTCHSEQMAPQSQSYQDEISKLKRENETTEDEIERESEILHNAKAIPMENIRRATFFTVEGNGSKKCIAGNIDELHQLRTAVAERDRHITELNTKLKQKEEQSEDQGKQIVRIQQQLNVNKLRCLTLSEQTSSKGEECESLEKVINKKDESIILLQNVIKDKEKDILRLRTEIKRNEDSVKQREEDSKNEQSRSEQMANQLKSLADEVSTLQKENYSFQEKLKISKAKATELERLTTEEAKHIEILEIQNNSYSSGVSEGYERAKQENRQEIMRLNYLIAERGQEQHTLRTQIAKMDEKEEETFQSERRKAETSQTELNEARTEISKLKAIKEKCRNDLIQAQQMLQTYQSDDQAIKKGTYILTQLQDKLVHKEKEISQLKEETRNYPEEIKSLRKELASSEHRYKELKESNSFDEERLMSQRKKSEEKDQHIKQMEESATEYKRENTALNMILKQHDESLKAAKDELTRAQSHSEELASDVCVYKEQLSRQEEQIKVLIQDQEQHIEAISKTAYEEGINEGFTRGITENSEEKDQHIKQMEESATEYKRENTALNMILKQHDESLKAAKDELARAQSHSEELASDVRVYKEQLSRQEEQIKMLIQDHEQHIEVIRKAAYEEGINEGFTRGITENSEELNRLQSKTIEQQRQATKLTATLAKTEELLKERVDELQKARQITESHKSEISKANQRIVKGTNPRQGNENAIYELQEKLVINESRFDHEKSQLYQQIKDLQQELQQSQQMSKRLSEENARNIERLAAEMNAKVSSDESALENISIQARPMKIAEDYNSILSNSWLDAKTALDDKDPDDSMEASKVILLFNILMVSEKQAITMYAQIVQQLAETLRNPVHKLMPCDVNLTSQTPDPKAAGDGKDLPQNLMTMIGDYFRSHSSTANLDLLHYRVATALKLKYGENAGIVADRLQIKDVMYFVTESARLAWKMVIQRPPMTFEASQTGQPWEKDGSLELIWGSDPNSPGAVIQYYKGPALLHAGNAMVKGKVFVHNLKNAPM